MLINQHKDVLNSRDIKQVKLNLLKSYTNSVVYEEHKKRPYQAILGNLELSKIAS